jgi:hypothetical protein
MKFICFWRFYYVMKWYYENIGLAIFKDIIIESLRYLNKRKG